MHFGEKYHISQRCSKAIFFLLKLAHTTFPSLHYKRSTMWGRFGCISQDILRFFIRLKFLIPKNKPGRILTHPRHICNSADPRSHVDVPSG